MTTMTAAATFPDEVLRLLTVSERTAVDEILPKLNPTGTSVLVMAKIGVARSAACQAMRLLEAAGLLYTRSMGPKGLEIKTKTDSQETAAERVVRLLTVSERNAVEDMLPLVAPGRDNIVVTANIAERRGTARSAACQAMRLLEASGIVHTRSLGPKGLMIRVSGPAAFSELCARLGIAG